MFIQLTEAEIQNLIIQPVERPECSAVYLEEREQAWSAQMERVQARNGHMWNGEIYTWEDILIPDENRVILRVSTCEYKDVVFRFIHGSEYVSKHYGDESLVRIMGVNVMPITTDGKFVFGQRADRPEQGAPVGGIGGMLNKDEIEIHTFADIRRHAFTELQEETALPVDPDNLRFFGLFAAGNTYHFLFAVRLAVDSAEIHNHHRAGEFSRLLALTEQEAREYTSPTTPMFRRWLPYLHLLPGFLAGAGPACGRNPFSPHGDLNQLRNQLCGGRFLHGVSVGQGGRNPDWREHIRQFRTASRDSFTRRGPGSYLHSANARTGRSLAKGHRATHPG